ncbi:MAG: NAD(P)H-dependent glycerol-3-phosphate dehydrogenase [candidate division WOR-3 bacterium]
MEKIAIMGAGSWGLTLARHLFGKGHQVAVWDAFPERIAMLADKRADELRLPGVRIPDGVFLSGDIQDTLAGADVCVMAVPSHGFRDTIRAALPYLPEKIVSATKGLELGTGKIMSGIIADEAPGNLYAALTGPSIAREVARGLPASVVAASDSPDYARYVQELFSTDTFRVYRVSDVPGAELGGALKNVIALACGMADGMGLGYNAKSALVTRGLAELMRLAVRLGARPETLAGLAGMGDLVVTAFSPDSRNRTLGESIGRGQNPSDALASMVEVAEGVNTASAARSVAQNLGVETPITDAVDMIMKGNIKPEDALRGLMSRPLKEEFYGVKEAIADDR